MDIKEQIDALTEAESKAALLWVLKRDAIITKISCEVGMESARFERSIVSYENEILEAALKEARDERILVVCII